MNASAVFVNLKDAVPLCNPKEKVLQEPEGRSLSERSDAPALWAVCVTVMNTSADLTFHASGEEKGGEIHITTV